MNLFWLIELPAGILLWGNVIGYVFGILGWLVSE